jgi:glycosyltransferase involved in cell wall biosynthesis
MLQTQWATVSRPSLRKESWHKPLVSVIITHFNYSDYVRDAILSLLDQTHNNWECVIVDDGSSGEHQAQLKDIVQSIACEKMRLLSLPTNMGQIPTFFAGFDNTQGEFVCLLDPDDRYTETFLEESVNAHLNKFVVCPITSTEQYGLTERGVTMSTLHHLGPRCLKPLSDVFLVEEELAPLIFTPRHVAGWHWTTTSAMMFRRSALKYLRPRKTLAYKAEADSFLAQGAHLLGGSLFLHKPLVYRTLHDNNAYISKEIFASTLDNRKAGALDRQTQCRDDAIETLLANGVPPGILGIAKSSPSNVVQKDKRFVAKWKRSIRKRQHKLLKFLNLERP